MSLPSSCVTGWDGAEMSSFPCLVRFVSASGQVRYRLGDHLVDRYLEFVAGRCRPNTLRAAAFDLKTFFTVTGKDPVQVTAADVFDFLADQRGDRTVVRLADRESGLSARTIARRLSSVSGLYAYLVARGDTPVLVNPVPRGLLTRRASGSRRWAEVGELGQQVIMRCDALWGGLAVDHEDAAEGICADHRLAAEQVLELLTAPRSTARGSRAAA